MLSMSRDREVRVPMLECLYKRHEVGKGLDWTSVPENCHMLVANMETKENWSVLGL